MIKVTPEKFFEIIGPLDVTLNVVGEYPYKTEFKLRNGTLVGYEDRISEDHGFFVTEKEYEKNDRR